MPSSCFPDATNMWGGMARAAPRAQAEDLDATRDATQPVRGESSLGQGLRVPVPQT